MRNAWSACNAYFICRYNSYLPVAPSVFSAINVIHSTRIDARTGYYVEAYYLLVERTRRGLYTRNVCVIRSIEHARNEAMTSLNKNQNEETRKKSRLAQDAQAFLSFPRYILCVLVLRLDRAQCQAVSNSSLAFVHLRPFLFFQTQEPRAKRKRNEPRRSFVEHASSVEQ